MIEFIKVRNVKDPIRDASENAGIDFFIPEVDAFFLDEAYKFGDKVEIDINAGTMTILPHGDVIIPSGIKSKFPNNLALVAYNKSGIATKKKLVVGAQVIDASYHGEWHLHLINTSDEPQTIEFGQKIVQFIPQVIDTNDIVMSTQSEEEFYAGVESKRKDGKFGSTGV